MSSADPPPTSRREELAARLAAVHERIERAKAAAGRGDDELGLVVVTKFFPASDVDLLAELGVSAIGENRDQEASAKVARLVHRDSLAVHFIGQLQSNKARSVATYADVVQSLDRPKVVRALDRAAEAHGRRLDVTVQVGLDGEEGRGGVAPDEVRTLADLVASCGSLTLRGVMAVAPLGGDARAAFARLRELSQAVRSDHPGAWWVSAGMSGDLEEAVAEGATHLRVGSAILGTRQSHE